MVVAKKTREQMVHLYFPIFSFIKAAISELAITACFSWKQNNQGSQTNDNNTTV